MPRGSPRQSRGTIQLGRPARLIRVSPEHAENWDLVCDYAAWRGLSLSEAVSQLLSVSPDLVEFAWRQEIWGRAWPPPDRPGPA